MTTAATGASQPGISAGPTSEFSLFFRVKPGQGGALRDALRDLQETPGYRPGDYGMAIRTIHEARFVLFDDDTRLAFLTSFDGPWDAYMEDFFTSGPTLALFDVISPCVTFNNHDGSTKSYKYAKDHEELLHEISFVPFFEQITVDYKEGEMKEVEMHDGSHIRLRKTDHDYDPTNKTQALNMLRHCQDSGEFLTGLIYVNEEKPDFLTLLNMVDDPLATLPQERVQPSASDLQKIMQELM